MHFTYAESTLTSFKQTDIWYINMNRNAAFTSKPTDRCLVQLTVSGYWFMPFIYRQTAYVVYRQISNIILTVFEFTEMLCRFSANLRCQLVHLLDYRLVRAFNLRVNRQTHLLSKSVDRQAIIFFFVLSWTPKMFYVGTNNLWLRFKQCHHLIHPQICARQM